MDKNLINTYLSNFRRLVSPYLKDNVSLKIVVYPSKDGCLMVFQFNVDGLGNTEIRSISDTIQEAMKRSDLFDEPDKLSAIDGTKSVVTSKLLVILKGKREDNWTVKAARHDVNGFIKAVGGK